VRGRQDDNPPACRHGGEGDPDFSPWEIDVLRLTAMGHSDKSIANTLHIGVKSIDIYKAPATEKLDFRNRVEVIGFALSEGWLSDRR
jgi:DNA-binding NarL/FixJ family response regulator